MVVVENQRLIWKFQGVFFPNQEELQLRIQDLTSNSFLRVCQTTAQMPDHPNLIERRIFRTSCIDLTKSLEVIYSEMDAKSCRYEIRRVERIGERVQIRKNNSTSNEDFLNLNNRFARLKSEIHPISRRGFQAFLRVSDVFVAYFDERPICGHLIIRDEAIKRAREILSASSRLESKEDARLCRTLNRYLHWYEIQTYRSEGFEVYDIGGIGDGSSSIAKFKLAFGGHHVQENNYIYAGALGSIGNQFRKWMREFRNRLHI
jgi:hypothetical protein